MKTLLHYSKINDPIHDLRLARVVLFGAHPARTRFASVVADRSREVGGFIHMPRGRSLVGAHVAFPPPILVVVGQEWWVYCHKRADKATEALVNRELRSWVRTSERA
uniref:Uncharacterized protein n=1 Tax=Chromera velia CCMP2878 TaxID=1169474 RepID=A0A0G4G1Y3_9ALVE|eukprot:Cvel_19858.t1-p1 / transcript=Cvel_19858.t1 / gene=Cvel_19858 / organism=Chromera_velia_CCMP2878 / gene_product=hypothetical protein / transcript_product=hypothetical protein / location=Cvel_scaffold1740:30986-31303(-) / protein_length=106 / sequence_SO=supercontig / SO=protein_coding / is_pseudo=false